MKGRVLIGVLCGIALAGCSGSGTVNPNANVSMLGGMHFSPQVATVSAGGIVTWTNNDSTNHTVTADSVGGPDSNTQFPGGLTPGDQFQFTVPGGTASGTHFFYHCSFHGAAGNGSSLGTGMAGEIIVR